MNINKEKKRKCIKKIAIYAKLENATTWLVFYFL